MSARLDRLAAKVEGLSEDTRTVMAQISVPIEKGMIKEGMQP
jgi:hypothetical protein